MVEGILVTPDEAFLALLLEHGYHVPAEASAVSRAVVAVGTAGDRAVSVDPAGAGSPLKERAGVRWRFVLGGGSESPFDVSALGRSEAVETRLNASPLGSGEPQGLPQRAAARITAPAARPRRTLALEGGGACGDLGVEDGKQLGHWPSLSLGPPDHPGEVEASASRYFSGSASKAARQPPQQK